MTAKDTLRHWISILFFTMVLLVIFATCQKETDKPVGNNKVFLSTISVDSVSYFLTKVSVQLTSAEKNTITDHGFCWAITPNPDINNSLKSLGKKEISGTFSAELNSLTENTRYYIRAFTTFAGNTIYNEQREITTLKPGKPKITTAELIDITPVSAVCGGKIESDSGYAITTSGICWDTDDQFNENQCLGKAINSSGNATYSINITELIEGTTYYVKAYATNQKGNGYGEIRPFSTATFSIPTVTTNAVTNPTANSAVCGGNVTSDGFASVTTRGVCWNTTGNPTLQNCINFTTNGNGNGTFTSNLTGLTSSTNYFVRAYATNNEGTAYDDDDVSFTTLAPWSCGAVFSITHIADNTAPVSKMAIYGTIETNLTGSNKCWITQNLGADHQAISATDSTEAAAGWYWQSNKKQGYKHDGTTRTPNTSWISNINENSDWLSANDPCSLLIGSGWRLPTKTEWETADATGGWDNYIETFSSSLKLHTAGYLSISDGSLLNRGSIGCHWSSTQYSTLNTWAHYFSSNFSSKVAYTKPNGFSVRCLRD